MCFPQPVYRHEGASIDLITRRNGPFCVTGKRGLGSFGIFVAACVSAWPFRAASTALRPRLRSGGPGYDRRASVARTRGDSSPSRAGSDAFQESRSLPVVPQSRDDPDNKEPGPPRKRQRRISRKCTCPLYLLHVCRPLRRRSSHRADSRNRARNLFKVGESFPAR